MFDAIEDEYTSRKEKRKEENNVHTNRTSHYGDNQKESSNNINTSLQFNKRNGIEQRKQNHLTQYKKNECLCSFFSSSNEHI